ncbi:hypothetical protein BDW68DRAFT_179441 [Aspergillus falconensis]
MPTAQYTTLNLCTLSGPPTGAFQHPPQISTDDEVPVIDLTPIDHDLEARKQLASKIRAEAENRMIISLRSHWTPEELIQRALNAAKDFFSQHDEDKEGVSHRRSEFKKKYHGAGTTQINDEESRGDTSLTIRSICCFLTTIVSQQNV